VDSDRVSGPSGSEVHTLDHAFTSDVARKIRRQRHYVLFAANQKLRNRLQRRRDPRSIDADGIAQAQGRSDLYGHWAHRRILRGIYVDLAGANVVDECRLAVHGHAHAVERSWRIDAVEIRPGPEP